MNSTLRDLLVLTLLTGGLFAVFYGWVAYGGGESGDDVKEQKEESLIGDDFKEGLAESFEEQLVFIENDYTRDFEGVLKNRFDPHLEDATALKDMFM